MLPNSVFVRVALMTDLESIKENADANRDYLGFVPRAKLTEAIQNQRVLVAADNNTLYGFIVFRHRKVDLQTTLSEICVSASERRKRIGQTLFMELIKECRELQRSFLQLKCPVDLPANTFYEEMGCQKHSMEKGKRRYLNVWRYYF